MPEDAWKRGAVALPRRAAPPPLSRYQAKEKGAMFQCLSVREAASSGEAGPDRARPRERTAKKRSVRCMFENLHGWT
jgi:hypothetical protein